MIQVLINNKQMVSPAGHIFDVPTQQLADAIAREWHLTTDEKKTKGYEGKLFTSLAATALDRMAEIKEEVISQLVKICENDQLLCWSEQLTKRQEQEWKPLITQINEQLNLGLLPRFDFHIRTLSGEEVESIKNWCKSLDSFQLSAFSYMCELSHSFILPFSLVEEIVSDARSAWAIAELQEIDQRSRWGKDSEDLQRSENLQVEFEQSYQFFKFAS